MKLKVKSDDNIVIFLICFIASLLFYYVHSRPGMIRSQLDVIYLLFGFCLPYIVGCVFMTKIRNKKMEALKNGK